MNMNGLINMVIRMFARKAVNRAMRTTLRGTARPPQAGGTGAPGASHRDAAKRARQAAKITRRFGR